MRSAILVSRLLILLLQSLLGVVQNVDFFRLHFSVQVEIESILFKIDWNEIVHSILVKQFHTMNSCSLTNFVNHTRVTDTVSHIELWFFVRDLSAASGAGAGAYAGAVLPNTRCASAP